jgi:hypothetical protein
MDNNFDNRNVRQTPSEFLLYPDRVTGDILDDFFRQAGHSTVIHCKVAKKSGPGIGIPRRTNTNSSK